MTAYDWEYGPEETAAFREEIAIEEEWYEYRFKNCYCQVSDKCECMSLEEFRLDRYNKMQDFFSYHEEPENKRYGECV